MLPFRDYNPARTVPVVTVALIAANVLVFLYMQSLALMGGSAFEDFLSKAAVIPAHFAQRPADPGTWVPVLTAMFMHGGWVHLLGNMLYLWIFGNNVEDIMGPVRYLLFYLLTGILATAAHVAATLIADPQHAGIPSLGASGAIAGVLGAYLVRFPRAQVDTCIFFFFVTVIRLPALIVLGFWFVLQLFSGTAALVDPRAGGGVAYWAHIGGFLAGMLLVGLFAKRRRREYNYPY